MLKKKKDANIWGPSRYSVWNMNQHDSIYWNSVLEAVNDCWSYVSQTVSHTEYPIDWGFNEVHEWNTTINQIKPYDHHTRYTVATMAVKYFHCKCKSHFPAYFPMPWGWSVNKVTVQWSCVRYLISYLELFTCQRNSFSFYVESSRLKNYSSKFSTFYDITICVCIPTALLHRGSPLEPAGALRASNSAGGVRATLK